MKPPGLAWKNGRKPANVPISSSVPLQNDMRKVGNRGHLSFLGEIKLEEWAAKLRITANRVERDRTGWDYLLEFPIRARI